MTFPLDSHTTTDVKLDMLSGVRTGNEISYDIYNICGIAHARTNRKDNSVMQGRLGQIFTCILEWGQRTCKKSRPYPARAYTTLVVLVFLHQLPCLMYPFLLVVMVVPIRNCCCSVLTPLEGEKGVRWTNNINILLPKYVQEILILHL